MIENSFTVVNCQSARRLLPRPASIAFWALCVAQGCAVKQAPAPEPTAGWNAKVVSIVDGDTIAVLRDRTVTKIRLAAIDTPERGQPFGKVAQQFTGDFLKAGAVRIVPITQDRYGRIVAHVYVDARSLSEALVAAGMAWHYRHFSDDPRLDELERQARAARRGLWQDAEPIPPWEWRRSH